MKETQIEMHQINANDKQTKKKNKKKGGKRERKRERNEYC